jgi:ketosteroid isomerase-like protein
VSVGYAMGAQMVAALTEWHRLVRERDADALEALLDEDVVFMSPVLHAPQLGRPTTLMYLRAALRLLNNGSFRYVGEWVGTESAVLEFETTLDGKVVNGVDMIWWNEAGRITRFKVMVRPLRGMEALRTGMAALLAT